MSTASSDVSAAAARPGVLANMSRALRHRNYRLFFIGQLISVIGTMLSQTAAVWFVYRLTGSTLLLGVVGFAGQIPLFLISPFAGVWADRVNKQKFVVLTQSLSSLQSFGLAAVAFYLGRGSHPNVHLAVPCLIGLALFQGVVNAFDMPTRQSFLIDMVNDRADLPNAIALNSTMVHTARLLGPAMAGLIIAAVGESLCFFIDGFSYVAVILSLLSMQIVARPPRPMRSVGHELREGFSYVWNFVPVRTLLLLMALLSLTGMPAMQILMPVFGRHFGGVKHGAVTFGFLGAASGLGALAGAIYLASRRTVLGLGRLIAWAAGIFGLSAIAFSQSNLLVLSLLIVPVAGWGMITNFASANTILQTLVDDDKRGRVMSFFGMAFVGMMPFGVLIAGFAAKYLTPAGGDPVVGASRWILIAGIISLLGALRFAKKLPSLRVFIRPIYVQRGVLPAVAEGLQVADATAPPE